MSRLSHVLHSYTITLRIVEHDTGACDGVHFDMCISVRSIFILSNETVNIWSHLLGFLLFFSLGVNDLSSVLPASGANREDYVIYAIGLFCFQVRHPETACEGVNGITQSLAPLSRHYVVVYT